MAAGGDGNGKVFGFDDDLAPDLGEGVGRWASATVGVAGGAGLVGIAAVAANGAPQPSPQTAGQAPQSASQEEQDSLASQVPSPQTAGQAPQSASQEEQDSLASQVPSPQTAGQVPQSAVQEEQDSLASQVPSPQTAGQAPQSAGQVPQVSLASQVASPHEPVAPRGLSAGPLPVGVKPPLVVRSKRSSTKPSSRIHTLMVWVPAVGMLMVAPVPSMVPFCQEKSAQYPPMRSAVATAPPFNPTWTESLVPTAAAGASPDPNVVGAGLVKGYLEAQLWAGAWEAGVDEAAVVRKDSLRLTADRTLGGVRLPLSAAPGDAVLGVFGFHNDLSVLGQERARWRLAAAVVGVLTGAAVTDVVGAVVAVVAFAVAAATGAAVGFDGDIVEGKVDGLVVPAVAVQVPAQGQGVWARWQGRRGEAKRARGAAAITEANDPGVAAIAVGGAVDGHPGFGTLGRLEMAGLKEIVIQGDGHWTACGEVACPAARVGAGVGGGAHVDF